MNPGSQKRFSIALAIWFLLSLSILLAPSPGEWGWVGIRIKLFYDEVRSEVQPAVHIILMAIGAFLLLRCFDQRPIWEAFLLSLLVAIASAVMFELLQGFLPVSFARRCDAEDLIPSIAGMLLGGGLGFFQRLRIEKRSA